MGVKYVDDFDFSRGFGFSGSNVGRHDPKPHPDRGDAYGDRKLLEKGDPSAIGMRKGGPVKRKADGGLIKLAGGGKADDGGAPSAPVYPPEALPGAPKVKPRADVVPASSRDYQQGMLHGARLGARMATQHVLGSVAQAQQQRARPPAPPAAGAMAAPMPMPQQAPAPAAPGALGGLKKGGHARRK